MSQLFDGKRNINIFDIQSNVVRVVSHFIRDARISPNISNCNSFQHLSWINSCNHFTEVSNSSKFLALIFGYIHWRDVSALKDAWEVDVIQMKSKLYILQVSRNFATMHQIFKSSLPTCKLFRCQLKLNYRGFLLEILLPSLIFKKKQYFVGCFDGGNLRMTWFWSNILALKLIFILFF